eukprot:jgi/Hompol1/3747/HPOL_003342-RA
MHARGGSASSHDTVASQDSRRPHHQHQHQHQHHQHHHGRSSSSSTNPLTSSFLSHLLHTRSGQPYANPSDPPSNGVAGTALAASSSLSASLSSHHGLFESSSTGSSHGGGSGSIADNSVLAAVLSSTARRLARDIAADGSFDGDAAAAAATAATQQHQNSRAAAAAAANGLAPLMTPSLPSFSYSPPSGSPHPSDNIHTLFGDHSTHSNPSSHTADAAATATATATAAAAALATSPARPPLPLTPKIAPPRSLSPSLPRSLSQSSLTSVSSNSEQQQQSQPQQHSASEAKRSRPTGFFSRFKRADSQRSDMAVPQISDAHMTDDPAQETMLRRSPDGSFLGSADGFSYAKSDALQTLPFPDPASAAMLDPATQISPPIASSMPDTVSLWPSSTQAHTPAKPSEHGVRLRLKGHLKNNNTFNGLTLLQELLPHQVADDTHSISHQSYSSSPSASSATDRMDHTEESSTGSKSRLRRGANSRIFDKESSAASNPVWILQFSHDGHYLASGHHDGSLVIWAVANRLGDVGSMPFSADSISSEEPQSSERRRPASTEPFVDSTFVEARRSTHATSARRPRGASKSSDSLTSGYPPVPRDAAAAEYATPSRANSTVEAPSQTAVPRTPLKLLSLVSQPSLATITPSMDMPQNASIFQSRPFRIYKKHSLPITCISWSKGGFIATGSMDNTVHLWHIKCPDSLCVFHHTDCVTGVSFHPFDDRLFVSGSLDGRVRLWSISEKKLKYWSEIQQSKVTAVTFNRDGSTVIAGTVHGDCVFYETNGLKYNTQIQAVSTTTIMGVRGGGGKVTGITVLPLPATASPYDERFLVTSSDSRLRIFNNRDKSLYRKYRSAEIKTAHFAAHASEDGEFLICPSEDNFVTIWDTNPPETNQHFSGVLTGMKQWHSDVSRNIGVERFVASDAAVTAAVFAPRSLESWAGYTAPSMSASASSGLQLASSGSVNVEDATVPASQSSGSTVDGRVVIVADVQGRIRVYQNQISSTNDTATVYSTATSTVQSIALGIASHTSSRLSKLRVGINLAGGGGGGGGGSGGGGSGGGGSASSDAGFPHSSNLGTGSTNINIHTHANSHLDTHSISNGSIRSS